jgi:hypothetical protein
VLRNVFHVWWQTWTGKISAFCMFLLAGRLLIGQMPAPRYDPIMFFIMCSYMGIIRYLGILAIWNEDKEMLLRGVFRTVNLLFWLVMWLRVILALGTLKEDHLAFTGFVPMLLLWLTDTWVRQTRDYFEKRGLIKRLVDVF